MNEEPHLILLPVKPQAFECSECYQLFLPDAPLKRTKELADEFVEHLRIRHPKHYKFPITVRVKLATVSERD